jgi:hypothetical protein
MSDIERRDSAGAGMLVFVLLVLLIAGGGAVYLLFTQARAARRAAEAARMAEIEQRVRAEEARAMAEAAAAEEARARLEAEAARGDAATERARAEAVAAFLTNMLATTDPPAARPELTVREVLDAAAAKLDGPERTDPAAEAALRDSLAKSYASLGLLDQADKQLLRAIELRTQLSGPADPQVKELQARLDDLRKRRAR